MLFLNNLSMESAGWRILIKNFTFQGYGNSGVVQRVVMIAHCLTFIPTLKKRKTEKERTWVYILTQKLEKEANKH